MIAPRRAAVVALMTFASLARGADSTGALINAQLDKPVKLDFTNAPLPKVLDTIEAQTGVPMRVGEDVYATLPWGRDTPITASVANVKLRDALAAIGGKLGLRFELGGEAIEWSVDPALARMGRRATVQELRALDLLRQTKLPAREAWTLATLDQAIDRALLALDEAAIARREAPPHLVLEVRPPASNGATFDAGKAAVLVPRDATLADALDAIARQTPCTWYPWGDSVIVLAKRDVVAARLERPISLRYDGVDLAQVLVDLSKQSGVPIAIEPGAIARVSPEFRVIKMSLESASLRQALESLQGYTGLGYALTDDGVYLWNQNSTPAASRGRVIATVEVTPGVSALIYEGDLSPEAREAIAKLHDEHVAKLNAAASATRPAEPNN